MSQANRFETLVDIFKSSIQAFPDRELFGTKRDGQWHWTTYAEFGKETDKFRAGLKSIGVEAGDKIAVIADNRVEWAVAAYACFGLGAALVPMYEAQLEKDWEFIIRDCDAKVAIVASDAILEKTKKFLETIPSLKHIVSLAPRETKADGKAGSNGSKNIHHYSELLETKAGAAHERGEAGAAHERGEAGAAHERGEAGAEEAAPAIQPKKEDVACLIYTSGTTGNPKGVILSHQNMASNVSAVHEVFPMMPEDRSLSFLPWAHSFGQTCELHALFSSGASIAICEAVPKIIDNLAEVHPTLLFSVPRIFNRIYASVQKQISEKPAFVQGMVKKAMASAAKEREGKRLTLTEHFWLTITDKIVFEKVRARFGGKLKYAFSGGAAISRDVAEFIDGLGIMVYEGYGLTETSPISTANYPKERRIGSVGRAIPGVRIFIDTTSTGGKKSEAGREEGEIIVYGPNVMVGYHNRKEENDAVFTKDGGFRTGDMGYLDPHGFLYITGRIKEQYKLENGKYVVPTPLEEELKLSSFVANAMVYGDNRPYNVALIVANVDAVKKWAAKEGVPPGSIEGADKLLAHPRVRDLFKAEVEKYSEKFKGFESVQDFALIADDFTADNGMLTPSLKLKRRVVLETHQPVIDALYKKKKEAKKGASAATAAS
jgi:long-chain acyl-CoA synthetase